MRTHIRIAMRFAFSFFFGSYWIGNARGQSVCIRSSHGEFHCGLFVLSARLRIDFGISRRPRLMQTFYSDEASKTVVWLIAHRTDPHRNIHGPLFRNFPLDSNDLTHATDVCVCMYVCMWTRFILIRSRECSNETRKIKRFFLSDRIFSTAIHLLVTVNWNILRELQRLQIFNLEYSHQRTRKGSTLAGFSIISNLLFARSMFFLCGTSFSSHCGSVFAQYVVNKLAFAHITLIPWAFHSKISISKINVSGGSHARYLAINEWICKYFWFFWSKIAHGKSSFFSG